MARHLASWSNSNETARTNKIYRKMKSSSDLFKHEKDKKKLFYKNIMCPCNNAEGDDGTAPLEEYYCLSGFCEYPGAWIEV